MNDTKNLILAIALSVLVLIGWAWFANHYFPTANPPSTKIVNGKQVPVQQPQSQQSSPVKAMKSVSAELASNSARRHPHVGAQRVDQPQGCADR